jgi:hypothetical protein
MFVSEGLPGPGPRRASRRITAIAPQWGEENLLHFTLPPERCAHAMVRVVVLS